MKSFKDFTSLDEALITFGGKAYPKFGQVVILAGGAGSGKGFTLEKLLGIEGITLDVDALKKLVMGSTKLAAEIKAKTGHDVKTMNLKKPGQRSNTASCDRGRVQRIQQKPGACVRGYCSSTGRP